MKWADRPEVKKGSVGERIVDEFLMRESCLPYAPTSAVGRHPIDRIYVNPLQREIFCVDIKTKPARTHYPDTGINLSHYEEYWDFKQRHDMLVWLFFVDEDERAVYGGELASLSLDRLVRDERHGGLKYPMIDGRIIYFPREAMEHIVDLTDDQVDEIQGLSTRKQAYRQAA